MCPEKPLQQPSMSRDGQRGFAIITAIFLLVVLAALGAAMMTFATAQHVTSAMDIQGSRAYQAARAGIEWGAYRALIDNSCAASSNVAPGADLSDFSVTVECSATTSGAITAWELTSTASTGSVGGIGYAERSLRATVSK